MLRHLSIVLLLFLSLAGIVHYGNKIRANWLPETPDPHPLTLTASGQVRAKPSVRQATRQGQVTQRTAAPVTSHAAAASSPSGNPVGQAPAAAKATLPATTPRTPPPSTDIHGPASTSGPDTLPTASTTHAAAPITAATLGPATSRGARPPTTTPSAHTPVSSPLTPGHTTGTHTQSSHGTALPATLFTFPHTGIASEGPARPTATTHGATQPTTPTSSAPGPTMAPQPSTTKTGTYQVFNGSRLCIKAEMGLELMVQELDTVFSPKSYISIDPNTTQVSGNCGFRKSNLLLNFLGGFVNLTFTKDENSYYISEVRAYLTVSNPEKSYSGMKSSLMMFEAVLGHSFKCVSEQSVQLSRHLQLKMMNTQLQAFDFEGAHFGNAEYCFRDTSRREAPLAVGLSLAALLVILLSACVVARRKPGGGYERV